MTNTNSSFIDAVINRAVAIYPSACSMEKTYRQALAEVLAAAGPIGYFSTPPECSEPIFVKNPSKWGLIDHPERYVPLSTAPPADERDARIKELERALGEKAYADWSEHNSAECVQLRTQLAAAQAALRLAKDSRGVMLLSDPPQDAWKARGVDAVIRAATATDQSAAGSEAE